MAKSAKKREWFEGTGRRKTSVARVRLFLGKEPTSINDKPIDEYFPGEVAQKEYERPFVAVNRVGSFSGSIKVVGGGKGGQLGAVVHGIANALLRFEPTFRQQLAVANLLTRDSRMKERRKYGFAGKARKRKQSPKR